MIYVTAVGRVVKPRSTEKTLSFALETKKPIGKDKQLVSVQVFLRQNAKVKDYVTQNKQIAITGKLEVGIYQGKKFARIIANSYDITLIDTRNKSSQYQNDTKPASQPDTPPTNDPDGDTVEDNVNDDSPLWNPEEVE